MLGVYEGPLKKAILDLKRRGKRSSVKALARAVFDRLPRLDRPLVGIPSTTRQKRYRGFEPAIELARNLAELYQVEHRPCLAIQKQFQPQKTLSALDRAKNLEGAFACPGKVSEAVCLVDDVVTTGATLKACRQVLREAGCPEVTAFCLARVGLGKAPPKRCAE